MTSVRVLLVPVALLVGSASLAACGSDGTSTAATTGSSTAATTIADGAMLIDVRMPEEFAAGHLDGAVNIPLEDGSLEAALGSLSGSDRYVVYCRTGRRSEIAARLMADAGFEQVTDLGGFEEARAATGLDVVTP
jgi:phage shock protein E